jgi:hypothetical protein
MDSKALRAVEIKDASTGQVSAVFSRFDVIDHDGDVTVKGAIKDGQPVVISAYNHGSWQGALPVGKGRVRVIGNEAILDGRFFLDTASGRDTFETVKQLAEDGLGEWSYGFDVLESERGEVEGKSVRILKELRVHEVSPVMLGAGVGTRTVGVKIGMKFSEEAGEVVASLVKLRQRAAEVVARRAEKGRGLGDESASLMKQIRDELARLDELLAEPSAPAEMSDAQREWLRSVANTI